MKTHNCFEVFDVDNFKAAHKIPTALENGVRSGLLSQMHNEPEND